MIIQIDSLHSHNGFYLKNGIIFEGSIGIIIGKNGSGKTRFLDSIIAGKSIVKINNEIIDTNQISLIDVKNPTNATFTQFGGIEATENLAKGLMAKLRNYESHDEIPIDEGFPLYPHMRMNEPRLFKVREIISRCESLFNKDFRDLSLEELELSLYAHNELNSNDSSTGVTSINLSQLTINYHRSLRHNRLLKFNQSEGENVAPIDSKHLLKVIGGESPHVLFNELINKLFRGKFRISEPNSKTISYEFKPQLIINSTNEEVHVAHLSSGEKTIFWLAVKTFETYVSSPNSVFGNKKLILIDEPDAHLHPQMIVDFFQSLNFLTEKLNLAFIFNTHSPTTVAICPNENIFTIENSGIENDSYIEKTNKDNAISQLLDGATQITINPNNSRQVYVEHINDSKTYELIYSWIKNRSKLLDRNIILNFISAGPKISDNELRRHISSVYTNDEKVDLLINKINGHANCEQVIGMVEYLTSAGNRHIRGLIDWDNKERKIIDEIIVMAKNFAYSIENLIYDPISIFAYLCTNNKQKPSYFNILDEYDHWRDLINSEINLQKIIDKVTLDVLGKENSRDHLIKYMNGMELHGDKEYYIPCQGENGHNFENKVLKKYECLKKLIDRTSGLPLIYSFASNATNGLLGPGYFNNKFEEAFVLLQK